MNKLVTSRDYNIHFYEIDYKKRALITSIMDYLCDVAVKQSEDIGVGLKYLSDNQIGWVIYKWNVDVFRYPTFNEMITVKTWPFSFRKFYAYRQFEVLDSKGQTICRADSVWFLIDMSIRKPKKITEVMYDCYQIDEEKREMLAFPKLLVPQRKDFYKEFNVRYSDIDTNKHVNNSKYIAWCIETVPLDIVETYTLNNIKVNYEKETQYGEMVNITTEVDKKEDYVICRHEIRDKEGKRLTLLETVWS